MLPLILATLSDAAVSIGRISKFLTAEELAESYAIDCECKLAVDVEGDFTWEVASKPVEGRHKVAEIGGVGDPRSAKKPEATKKTKPVKRRIFRGKGAKEPVLPTSADSGKPGETHEEDEEKKPDEKPFELKNLKFKVPRGAFVAIVGRVGSGKVIRFYIWS